MPAVHAASGTELILASASPRRRALLAQAGFRFRVQSSRYHEGEPSGDPAVFALAAGMGKARDVAGRRNRPGWVLGADTVVAKGRTVFGKPKDREQARRMLGELSGRRHEVLTGVALIPPDGRRPIAWVERTEVWMRKIGPTEMEAYLDSREWADKAGGYGVQGLAGAFVTRIEGCYFNVVGLPLARLSAILRKRGIGQ